MPRCGSGFVTDLLLSSPSLELPAGLKEDYVMENAHLLLEYVEKTYARWRGFPWIEKPEECRNGLLRCLSDGILELLMNQVGQGKRLLIKTTAASNVDKLFQFFPQAKLLILIRDGRDTVESAAVKWPRDSFEGWARQWAEGARSILKFMELSDGTRGKSWQLMKYEDVVQRPAAVMGDLLHFLELNSDDFKWDRIERLPVHGSSQSFEEKANVSGATQRPAGFNPIGRWKSWGWSRKRVFKKIAGRELIALGYAADDRW
jgi:hypothetical protein